MFASQMEKLIKESLAWGSSDLAIDSLPKLMQLAQKMAHNDNDQIYYIDQSRFTAFISEQANQQIADKIKSEQAPLNWRGEPQSDEERIASEQRQLPIEGYIEEARPFIQFILSCNNKNLRETYHSDTLKEYASNSFLSTLSKNFSKTLSILAPSTEFGKLVFVHTLGLNFLFDYTTIKFKHHMFLSLNLPTIGVRPHSIALGTIRFDLNPVNTFILPFHYIARNLGKLVGFTVGLLTTMVLSPFVLLKSVHEARTAQNRLQHDINESDKKRKESLDAYINHLPNILVTINDDNADDFYTLYKNLFSQYPTYTQKMLDDIAKKAKECNKSVYYLLGTLYQDLGMNDEACESYSQMDPTHHAYMECMVRCGKYAYANKNYFAARKYFSVAISVGQSDQTPLQTVYDCKKLLQAVDVAIIAGQAYTLDGGLTEKNAVALQTQPLTSNNNQHKRLSFIENNLGLILTSAMLISFLVVTGIFTFGAVPLVAAGVTAGFALAGVVLSAGAATSIGMAAITLGAFFLSIPVVGGVLKAVENCILTEKKAIVHSENNKLPVPVRSKSAGELPESRQAASLQVIKQPCVGVVAGVPGTTFYRNPAPEPQVDASHTLVRKRTNTR